MPINVMTYQYEVIYGTNILYYSILYGMFRSKYSITEYLVKRITYGVCSTQVLIIFCPTTLGSNSFDQSILLREYLVKLSIYGVFSI